MFNCLYEAAMQEAIFRCSCYPGFLSPSNSSCSGKSLKCFQDVFYYVGKYRSVEDRGTNKTCMAACEDQTFSVTASSSRYPGAESYNHRPAFCIIVKSESNFIVRITFSHPHFSQETLQPHLPRQVSEKVARKEIPRPLR